VARSGRTGRLWSIVENYIESLEEGGMSYRKQRTMSIISSEQPTLEEGLRFRKI
jgi:hypothetical protein